MRGGIGLIDMARIVKIVSVVKREDKRGVFFITTALLDSGDEVTGVTREGEDIFMVGEKVNAFFDDRYNRAKMKRLTSDVRSANIEET
jgi:hypothetical protein